MGNKIKNFLIGVVVSLNKVQENISQTVNGIDNNISIQKEVEKHEIKLVTKSRFYDILNKADKYERALKEGVSLDILNNKDLVSKNPEKVEAANQKIREALNSTLTEEKIKEIEDRPILGFRNQRFGSLMEDINNLDEDAKYKFSTNNDLYKYASNVKIHYKDDGLFLEFIVNSSENPKILMMNFEDLNHFSVVEKNAKTYEYEILSYEGTRVTAPFEKGYMYKANILKNGEYNFEMDDKINILNKKNTPAKNTAFYK